MCECVCVCVCVCACVCELVGEGKRIMALFPSVCTASQSM